MNLSIPIPVRVRLEEPGDVEAIRRINELAFGGVTEADVVDVLRGAGAVALSMVAVADGDAIGGAAADGEVVGHALFSPVTIDSGRVRTSALGLGPMAVRPDLQRRGVGTVLIDCCLEHLRAAGYEAVVVVGHPAYYPRFGFLPASKWALRWEADVSDEAFMALELRAGALSGVSGAVRYRPEFAEV
ncbi:MAG: N-acetyltransferase [bacterium]